MTIEKRIERIEAILDARGLDWDHPRVEEAVEVSLDGLPDIRTFAQPNLRWRILEPGEVVQEGDWVNAKSNLPSDPPNGLGWKPAISAGLTVLKLDGCVFARPVADEPAKEPAKEPEHPAWEPKVGDWVRVTRPEKLGMGVSHSWSPSLDKFDGKVGKIESDLGGCFHICGFAWPSGLRFIFDRDWLSPAEPPKDEYREPVLPADAGKWCEFSDDGKTWRSGYLKGFDYGEHRHQGAGWRRNENCSSDRARHRFARIKVDA